MTHINFSIYSRPFTKKPEEYEISAISSNLSGVFQDLETMASGVAINGYTLAPAIFAGQRSNENFISQQLFMLDFDGGLSFDDAYNICKEWQIKPCFAYETFGSSSDLQKFRLAFIYPDVITNKAVRDTIQSQLMAVFHGKIDPSCRDAARMFFGSNHGLLYKCYESVIDPETLQRCSEAKLRYVYGKKSYRYLGRVGFGADFDSSNIYIGKEKSPPYLYTYPDLEINNHKTVMKACPAYSDILIGKDLHHDIKFGVLTSVQYIPKLRAEFVDQLCSFNPLWDEHYKYVRRKKYNPECCERFNCPYDCGNKGSLYSKLQRRVQYQIYTDTTPYISIEEQMNNLKTALEIQDDKKIHIIKSQAGVGKSELLLDKDDCTICFPTHELKNELVTRHKKKWSDKPLNVTPDLPDFLSSADSEKVNLFYRIGLYKKADSILRKYSRGYEYIENRKKPLIGTTFTTHSKIFHNTSVNPIVIFDEDPIKEIISIGTGDLKDLTLFISWIKNRDIKLSKYLQQFEEGLFEKDKIIKTDEFIYDLDSLIDQIEQFNSKYPKIQTSIIDILLSTHWTIGTNALDSEKIYYSRLNNVPPDKTIVILSATADECLYRYLFGDRIVMHDCGKTKYTGTVVQHLDKSWSKLSLSNAKHYESDIEKVKSDTRPVITFKEKKDALNPEGAIVPHFGATTGVDYLAGKDIIVAGTYRSPVSVILLYAAECNLPLNSLIGKEREKLWVHINHCDVEFYTFSNPDLQAIDLAFIRSELEQAVGRARLLRNSCSVEVYSNFPIEQGVVIEK